MHLGKKVRMERFFNRHIGRSIIVPMDHGVTVGPIHGIADMRNAVDKAAEGGADAVLMHKGLVRCSHRGSGRDIGLIVHLSASTALSPAPNSKTLVGTVEEAVRLGADGVSVHVNLGDEDEKSMLADFGRIARSADDWGMPLLAMVYARGPKISDEYDPGVVAHCARVGVELGADVVKVAYTGDMESFSRVAEACCIPVIIAGGAKMDSNRDILQMVHDSLKAGGGGISLGRNVFQHERPQRLLQALRGLVHEDWDVEQALALMES
ncbi:MAG: 2-amino-3,7-dideoxy-D-threo-hept-6-ulosonate synthase [Desulfovibrio sp.]|jgi:class I fructose-bisphosphate aldolase|nr:2-amino-3,7-dideoxy-D-threo-hept-6-ulosonate synthase [Desulfovibrio sp.]